MSELIQALEEEIRFHGDLNIHICRYTDEERKYYWMSCAFVKKDIFIIGYNIDPLIKTEH